MDKKLIDITYFLSFCIEKYMNTKKLSESDVLNTFTEFGVLEYLNEHFEVLHTQSWQWLIEDIDEFIDNKKKGRL